MDSLDGTVERVADGDSLAVLNRDIHHFPDLGHGVFVGLEVIDEDVFSSCFDPHRPGGMVSYRVPDGSRIDEEEVFFFDNRENSFH